MDMELLAPAGGFEQLQYAIRFGADAAYMACDRFGMRPTREQLRPRRDSAAIDYAHARDVKVYVTLNIVMHDDDIEMLGSYARTLRDAGVDAFIIGDLGAARLVREIAPEVDLAREHPGKRFECPGRTCVVRAWGKANCLRTRDVS